MLNALLRSINGCYVLGWDISVALGVGCISRVLLCANVTVRSCRVLEGQISGGFIYSLYFSFRHRGLVEGSGVVRVRGAPINCTNTTRIGVGLWKDSYNFVRIIGPIFLYFLNCPIRTSV
jgi:hypothetical protein